MSHASTIAKMVAAAPARIPTGFAGNSELYGFNLFLMTAAAYLGAMMMGKIGNDIWKHRAADRFNHPVTVWRIIPLLASTALTLRCGAEAVQLWAWKSNDPTITAHAIMAKRWIDPFAVACGMLWLAFTILSNDAMTEHLRRRPLPVNMWAKWRKLIRPALLVLVCFAMAGAVVFKL